MRVTLIGSGNVATLLGRKIYHAGHPIHQVYSRNAGHALSLATDLLSEPVSDPAQIDTNADLYVLAVSDEALHDAHQWLHLGDRLVVHTAGSVPIDTLKKISTSYGVLYPLQTLHKKTHLDDVERQPLVPILIDGNTELTRARIHSFAQSFSPLVSPAGDRERSVLHLAAVMTNNFSNHLFALTEAYCKREGADFQMIIPLLEETVQKLHDQSPARAQTGPAVRNDTRTIHKHLDLLKDHPQLLRIYEVMTQSIRHSTIPEPPASQ